MKITYRIDKKSMQKTPDLRGVTKASEYRPTKPTVNVTTPKKSSRVRWGFSMITGLVGFIVLVAILYFIKIPFVTSSIAILTNDRNSIPEPTYTTIPLGFDSTVSTSLQDTIKTKLAGVGTETTKRFSFTSESSDVAVKVSATVGQNDTQLYKSYLVPVGHMYWVRDTVSKTQLEKDTIYVAQGKKTMFEPLIAEYLGKTPNIKETANLADTLKKSENAIGFVEAADLSGSYKVLIFDNHFFLDKDMQGGIAYSVILTGSSALGKAIVISRTAEVLPQPFDETQILSLNMTGVTAITRGAGIKTARSGNGAYVAEKIAGFLSKTDLTHVSNEISFADGCTPQSATMAFCAVNNTIDALKKIGVDIVELTGNHNNDYGAKWNTSTINKYKKLGWDYFGGGLNATDAKKILYKDIKGTKLAFIGYDYYDSTVGSPGALATASRAGANKWSKQKVVTDVAEARKNADIVIVDFQYQECWSYTDNGSTVQSCYSPLRAPPQVKDFRQAIDAGADIVVGVQAHQPQTYEVYKGKVIYYGLGNLFFDQTQQLGTRQGMILTHYFYKGQFMGTKVTTTLYDAPLQTYITTGSQRSQFLTTLKKARNF